MVEPCRGKQVADAPCSLAIVVGSPSRAGRGKKNRSDRSRGTTATECRTRRRGRPLKDDRLMFSAMIYVLRTGAPWRDLPDCFGRWTTAYSRFRRWCASGLFARMPGRLARSAQGRLRHLDCSPIKLHQDGANLPGGQAAQAMGRTKGGLNTKLAAVVDARGRALAVCLASGPRHDQHAVLPVLGATRGRRLVGDKGFDSAIFRAQLLAQRTRSCIPPRRSSRRAHAWHRGYHRQRHHVENFFGRIKRHRRISTRYDKLASTFLGFVHLAAALDWLTP